MYKALLVVAALLSPATATLAQSLPAGAVPYQSGPNFNTDSSTSSQADITNPGGFGSPGKPARIDSNTTGSVSNDVDCRSAHTATHKGAAKVEKVCR